MATKKIAAKKPASAAKSIDAKVQQAVAQELKLLDDIAGKSKKVLENAEDELYARLRETYVLYYKWMESKHKAQYFDALEDYLNEKRISHNAGTSEALMMTKAILGEANAPKASKYGTHMDTAYRKGITPKEYPAWMQDNGIEIVSRRKPLIPNAKKAKIDDRALFKRASVLISKWLEIKEALPIATTSMSKGGAKSYGTLKNEKFTNTVYEIAICKRRKDKSGKDALDTLWLLPKTVAIEKIYMHQLAYAIHRDVDHLEAQMADEELKVLGTEIDQLMLEDEIYQFAYQDDQRELSRKVEEAYVKGEDVGHVYANHRFNKPKVKRAVSKIVKPLNVKAKVNGKATTQLKKAIKLTTKTKATKKIRKIA